MDKEQAIALASLMAECVNTLKGIIPYIHSNSGELGRLDQRVKDLEEQAKDITKVIYEGNPHQAGLLQELYTSKASHDKLESRVKLTEDASVEHIRVKEFMKSQRTQVRIAWIVAITSIVTTIITVYHVGLK